MNTQNTGERWKLVKIESHPNNPGEQIAFIQGPKVCFDFSTVENEKFTREEFTKAAHIATAAPEMFAALNAIKSFMQTSAGNPCPWPIRGLVIDEAGLAIQNAQPGAIQPVGQENKKSLHEELVETLVGVTKALERVLYKHDRDSIEHEWIGEANEVIKKATGQDLSKFKASFK